MSLASRPIVHTFKDRSLPRYTQRLTVQVAVPGGTARMGYTENVSAQGLFLLSTQPAPVSMHVVVNVRLPDEVPVSLLGRVVWRRTDMEVAGHYHPAGFGIEIVQAPDAWYEFCRVLAES